MADGAAAVELADRVIVLAKVDCSVDGTDMVLDGLMTGTLKLPPVPAAEGTGLYIELMELVRDMLLVLLALYDVIAEMTVTVVEALLEALETVEERE